MRCLLVSLLFIMLFPLPNVAQEHPWGWDLQTWKKGLSNTDYQVSNLVFYKYMDDLIKADTSTLDRFLLQLETAGKNSNDHFHARLYSLKAVYIYHKKIAFQYEGRRNPINIQELKSQFQSLFNEALRYAYRSEDDRLIAFTSWLYVSVAHLYNDKPICVMYGKNAIETYERLNHPISPEQYQLLSEILYSVKEYQESIGYAKKAAILFDKQNRKPEMFTISNINTIGLSYNRLELYDSAMFYYKQALSMALKGNSQVWEGIVSGNMAQVLYAQKKYDEAAPLFRLDYERSIAEGYFDNAGHSLQWLARTQLALGKKDSALKNIREAFAVLAMWRDAGYQRNAYLTASEIFRSLGNYDSAFYYKEKWIVLNDSLEKAAATASLEISKARLNDEQSRYKIQKLNREKKNQLLTRNLIIACIVLLGLVGFLYLNKLRVKHLHKEQLALQQKNAAEQQAREQLSALTQNLIERTALAEDLQMQISRQSESEKKQDLIHTLSNLTILTEADWEKFKNLFEQLYPCFFVNLKEKIPDISIAESRMAALSKLNFSTSQVASVLGISQNSVYKSRQRLRQRMGSASDAEMQQMLAAM